MASRTALESLLTSTTWLRTSHDALSILPEVALGLPPLLQVPNQRPDDEPVLPMLGMSALADAVAATLLGTQAPDAAAVESLDEETLRKDPLVHALADLFVGCAARGLQRTAVPALATAWLSSRLLSGQDLGVLTLADERRSAVEQLGKTLAGKAAAERGKALSTLAWELAGRLTAGFQVALTRAPTLQDDPLMRKVLTDPLVVSCARGTLDRDPDPALVGAVVGVPVEAGALQHLDALVLAALTAADTRRSKGKQGAMDFALAEQVGDLRDPSRILYKAGLGPFVLAALPDLVTARDLKAAGVPSAVANQLLSRPGALALAATWRDLVQPLLAWDLASALVDRVVPLAAVPEGGLRSAAGTVRQAGPMRFLVPREASEAVVVAGNLAALRQGLGSSSEAENAWTTLCVHQKVPAHCVEAGHGLAAFEEDVEAFAFAQKVGELLSGPRSATLASGERRTLDLTHIVSLGVARGLVEGGSDGRQTRLFGPAVSEALALCGTAAGQVQDPTDRLGQRRAGPCGQGFANSGLVLSGPALKGLLEGLRRSQAALHVQGDGSSVGGVSGDFQHYPVPAWWNHDGKVAMALSLADPPDALTAAEVQVLDREDFDSFHRADQEIQPVQAGSAVRARKTSSEISLNDPFRQSKPPPVPEQTAHERLGKVDSLFGFVTTAGPDSPESTAAREAAPAPVAEPDPVSSPSAPVSSAPKAGGLLDAFTRTDEPTPEPPVGRLALVNEQPTQAPSGVGRLSLLGEDDEDDPTAATDLASAGPVLDIEDDDEEEEEEVQALDAEDSWVGEAELVEDYDDFVDRREPELSILEEGLSARAGQGPVDATGFSLADVADDEEGPPPATSDRLPETPSESAAFGFSLAADEDEPADSPQPPSSSSPEESTADPLVAELVRMFEGYVVVESSGSFLFGLPKTGTLRDALTFETDGDEHEAYRRFLQYKISNGFVTEAHKVSSLSEDAVLRPLDGLLLREAYGEVAP